MRPSLIVVAALLAAFASGCAGLFPAPSPMKSIDWKAEKPARCLIVFLPGRGDDAEYFETRGFVTELKRRKLAIDMVAADAWLGYYLRGTLAPRLHLDVVRPRLYRDYEEIWLVGMSMGGLGTLLYARQRPVGEITGVLALAPFLGDRDLLDEIAAQGGLTRWQAPPRSEPLNERNYQKEIWRWLQAVTQGDEPGPLVYLGYGRADRLAFAGSLLAAELPEARVFVTDGGHDWGTWLSVWRRFLDSRALAARCR